MQIGNHNYEIGRLDAFDQFHVSRKIAPIVPTIVPFMTEILKS
ncbi:phage tail assembly chaperone, partial [Acinetobacter baumannii]